MLLNPPAGGRIRISPSLVRSKRNQSLAAQRASNTASVSGGSRTMLRGVSASMGRRAGTALILPPRIRCGADSLYVDLTFYGQKLIQDFLDDLLWRAFRTDPHQIGGHFEGVELAL